MADTQAIPIADTQAAKEQMSIAETATPPLKEGDCWYLIERNWWVEFCEYAGLNPNQPSKKLEKFSGVRPGKIDNSAILNKVEGVDFYELKEKLLEYKDFACVHSNAWEYLEKSYGGGPPIRRMVIALGIRKQMTQIEYYPLLAKIFIADSKTGEPEAGSNEIISKYVTFDHVLLRFNPPKKEDENKDVEPESMEASIEGRVWLESDKDKWVLLPKAHQRERIDELDLRSCKIMLEYKQDKWLREAPKEKDWRNFEVGDIIDGRDKQGNWYEAKILKIRESDIYVNFLGWDEKWNEFIDKDGDGIAPKNTNTTGPYTGGSGYSSSGYRFKRQNSVGTPDVCGAVGLRNLGNTCFMNSTLQCLSNTPGLTEFFRDGHYEGEINRKNPLGWGGKIAEAYGALIKDMWSDKFRTIAPTKFKRVIGEFQPRFSGYQQHDSSELLSFLMDGLHEDLNRVRKKPPTQPVESDGRPDEIVAKEAWERHLARNQSIIVDLCQGQLKSRVVCPDCDRESITFDPFMLLSVPLPQVKDRSIKVIYQGRNSEPIIYMCKVPSRGSAYQIKENIAKFTGVDEKSLVMTQVSKSRISKVCPENQKISQINKTDMWVHEIVVDNVNIPLINKERGTDAYFGAPILIPIEASKITCLPINMLRERIKEAITPFLGEWNAEDTDQAMYKIMVYNKKGEKALGEIPFEDGIIDLRSYSTNAFSFGLSWNEISRKRYQTTWKKHSSYTEDEHGFKKSTLHVTDCIREFTKEETLSKNDAWYCPECKKHQCGRKKFDLWKTPDVLIIHLKRFNYDRYHRTKLDTKVDFHIEGLDLSPFIVNSRNEKSAIYDLYAVSNHFGGMGGGHYTAYAKNIIDGKWYNLDDSSVNRLSNPNKSRTKYAYVLFYRRRK